ncbi:MAG: hypothetical protein PVG39_22830, partial [Desulfobacteraceae bacterium]
FITWACVPLELITALDQPNRVLRTRMLRGVGGDSREAIPYPDGLLPELYFTKQTLIYSNLSLL